jgi:hypothetical protein
MPKAKPDQTVAFRIELQEKERELLEAWVGGSIVKNAVQPIAMAAAVGSATWIGYKTAKGIVGWTEDALLDGGLYRDIVKMATGKEPEDIPGAKPAYSDNHLENAIKGLAGIVGYGWLWGK